jgi:hypothetical protein
MSKGASSLSSLVIKLDIVGGLKVQVVVARINLCGMGQEQ